MPESAKKLKEILIAKMTFSERLKAIEDAGYLWTLGCGQVIEDSFGYSWTVTSADDITKSDVPKYGVILRESPGVWFVAIGNSPEQAICKALKKALLKLDPNAKFHGQKI